MLLTKMQSWSRRGVHVRSAREKRAGTCVLAWNPGPSASLTKAAVAREAGTTGYSRYGECSKHG